MCRFVFTARLWTRVPLSVLQESVDQQVVRAAHHVRIQSVSDLQGKITIFSFRPNGL